MKNPQMMLGIHPTCWTNDDFPEIGDQTPYQEILRQTREAGFAGGSTGHNYPAHPRSLLKAMEDFTLRIAATWAGTSFSTGVDVDGALARFQDGMNFLKRVEAKDVVVAELVGAVNQMRDKSVLTDRPVMNNAQWYLLTTLLNQAGKMARDQGMQLSYHPHVGTVVQTMEETHRLLENTDDAVGLCLDTGHLRYAGATQDEIVELVQRYLCRVTHVHLKNVRSKVMAQAVGNQFSFYQAIQSGIFTVPGDPEGDLDLAPIVQLLRGNGYSGWMIIEAEQNPARAEPLRYAKMARAFLKQQLNY